MINLPALLVFTCFSFVSESALAWSIFEPKSFDDCILKNMKGVTSDDAAVQIRVACMNKFPQGDSRKCKLREMTSAESAKVTGTASVHRLGQPYFSGSFYNGNDAVAVEAITVIFTADNIKPPQEYDLFLDLPIQPRSSKTAGATVQIAPDKNFRWGLKSLKTCVK